MIYRPNRQKFTALHIQNSKLDYISPWSNQSFQNGQQSTHFSTRNRILIQFLSSIKSKKRTQRMRSQESQRAKSQRFQKIDRIKMSTLQQINDSKQQLIKQLRSQRYRKQVAMSQLKLDLSNKNDLKNPYKIRQTLSEFQFLLQKKLKEKQKMRLKKLCQNNIDKRQKSDKLIQIFSKNLNEKQPIKKSIYKKIILINKSNKNLIK